MSGLLCLLLIDIDMNILHVNVQGVVLKIFFFCIKSSLKQPCINIKTDAVIYQFPPNTIRVLSLFSFLSFLSFVLFYTQSVNKS